MGPAAWQGTVVAKLPLLSAPDRVLTCPPGETINVPVSLTGQAVEELAVGVVRWENVLAVTGGREPVSASVQVDVREVTLELHLETPTLNFGQVNGAIADMPADTVRVLNAGPISWMGRVEIVVPWLSAEGESRAFDLEIPRMSVAEFRVQLNESARLIPPGVIQEERAIVIRSRDPQPSKGGPPLQEMVVRALLVASEWAPRLEIRPEKIVLSGAEPQTLRLRNVGTRSWSLQINPASWLSIAPVDIVLKSGAEQAVEIRHKASVRDSATILDDPRAIVIVGPGWEREIGVEVRLPKAVSAPESLSQPATPSPSATQLPSLSLPLRRPPHHHLCRPPRRCRWTRTNVTVRRNPITQSTPDRVEPHHDGFGPFAARLPAAGYLRFDVGDSTGVTQTGDAPAHEHPAFSKYTPGANRPDQLREHGARDHATGRRKGFRRVHNATTTPGGIIQFGGGFPLVEQSDDRPRPDAGLPLQRR
jgi:hypothetical protein